MSHLKIFLSQTHTLTTICLRTKQKNKTDNNKWISEFGELKLPLTLVGHVALEGGYLFLIRSVKAGYKA